MYAYIGRQPLYNKEYVLYGYDLLHRDNVTKNLRDIQEEDDELRGVFSDAITMFDFSELTEGKPAHIRLTRNLLFSNFPYMASPEQIVVELSADIMVDDALVEKIHELKNFGYKLAVSGYSVQSATVKLNKIIQWVDFIYINVRRHNRLQLIDLIKNVRLRSHAKLLAEQVDNEADFDKISGLSFTYFQGLLFGMPSVFRREVNLATTPYGKLYNELASASSNFESACAMIEQEPVLTYMFLERMPSPKEKRDIGVVIRKTLMTIGTERLRKWSCLLLIKQLNVNDTTDLAAHAFQRARFIERIMDEAGAKDEPILGFFLGIFSLIDQITDTPLENLLNQLRLERSVKDVLLGKEQGSLAAYLHYAEVYEETGAPPADTAIRPKKAEKELDTWYKTSVREAEDAFSTLNPYLVRRNNR